MKDIYIYTYVYNVVDFNKPTSPGPFRRNVARSRRGRWHAICWRKGTDVGPGATLKGCLFHGYCSYGHGMKKVMILGL